MYRPDNTEDVSLHSDVMVGVGSPLIIANDLMDGVVSQNSLLA